MEAEGHALGSSSLELRCSSAPASAPTWTHPQALAALSRQHAALQAGQGDRRAPPRPGPRPRAFPSNRPSAPGPESRSARGCKLKHLLGWPPLQGRGKRLP